MPPKKAKVGVKKYNSGKNAVINTAVKLAPLLIPIIPGSASGFFITACSNTPETAVAAPPSKAIKILGNLKSKIVATSLLYSKNSPLKSSTGVAFKLPVFTAKRNKAISPVKVTMKDITFFLLLIKSNPP